MLRYRHLLTAGVFVLAAACGGDDNTSDLDDNDDTASVATGARPGETADDAASEATSDTDGETSGDDSGATSDTEAAADEDAADNVPALPAACVEPTLRITIDGLTDGAADEAFVIAGRAGTATPIVPNGDGALDDVAPSKISAMGVDTELLTYTQWVGNHPFDGEDLGLLSGPTPPPGSLSIALSVTPPTLTPLATGDVVASNDPITYDAITTFATVSAFVLPPEGVDTFVLFDTSDPLQGGTATVEYVDAETLCVSWEIAGETRSPDGTFHIAGTVVTDLSRSTVPFT